MTQVKKTKNGRANRASVFLLMPKRLLEQDNLARRAIQSL